MTVMAVSCERALESNRPERGTVFADDVAANVASFAQRIFPTNVQVGDAFGWEVEMDSNGRVIAGAYGEDIRIQVLVPHRRRGLRLLTGWRRLVG